MQKLKIACYLLVKAKHFKFGNQQHLKNLGYNLEKNPTFIDLALNGSCNLTNNSEGRISLTSKLLKHAKIKNSMLFVGQGKTFQIWEPTIFEKFRVTARRKSNIHRTGLKWERQFNN